MYIYIAADLDNGEFLYAGVCQEMARAAVRDAIESLSSQDFEILVEDDGMVSVSVATAYKIVEVKI